MAPIILHIASISLVLLLFKSWTKAEFYTAIAEMEPLLKTQKRIIDDLNDYILKEEKRLEVLKSYLELYSIEHEKALEDIPNYLGNPINAFTLIERLTIGLEDIYDNILIGKEYIKNITTNHDDVEYPTFDDLEGAAQALTRLQATYRLDVHDLAEGVLNGVKYSHRMTAIDCFEVSRAVFNLKDFTNALAWSTEALRKFREEQNVEHTFTEADILEYISFSYFGIGDVNSALNWTNRLLELDPKHPRAHDGILLFEKALKEQKKNNEKIRLVESSKTTLTNNTRSVAYYQSLCRGEGEISSDISKRLSCRYLTEHHPFLRLAPIKVEQMYIDPDVMVFYQVISDEEIQVFKNMSLPKFERAAVYNFDTGMNVNATFRISKSAWLTDDNNEAVARLNRRVADMTGLSVWSAEPLHVINYGIGGYYEPHYDFNMMSEVAQGGATVFTKLGLSVFPVKHAALFWMNLHPSGEENMAMLHAACPVLKGSKWVCNKWLHENGQELLKPCNAHYQEEGIIRNTPRGIL